MGWRVKPGEPVNTPFLKTVRMKAQNSVDLPKVTRLRLMIRNQVLQSQFSPLSTMLFHHSSSRTVPDSEMLRFIYVTESLHCPPETVTASLIGCVLSHFSCVQLFATLWILVHWILQARIPEWVAMPSSRGSSLPRDQTCISYISCIGRQVLYH